MESQNSDQGAGQSKGISIFEAWKEYESIAVHFNDLLIRLRIQALGGVAAISALVGFLSKGDTPENFRWGILAVVFFILALFWIAVWILDFRYYHRLLLGAVASILRIEERSRTHTHIEALELSHNIERAVSGKIEGLRDPGFFSGLHWFYSLVLAGLLLALWLSPSEYCLKAPNSGLGHMQGICRLTVH